MNTRMNTCDSKIYGPSISKHPDNGMALFKFTHKDTSLVLRIDEDSGDFKLYSKVHNYNHGEYTSVTKYTDIVEGKIMNGAVMVWPLEAIS